MKMQGTSKNPILNKLKQNKLVFGGSLKRNFVLNLSLFILFLSSNVLSASSQKALPPNIIMVFVDDMGWGDFSCFGNKDVQTPHVDGLSQEGIRFYNFYVNSPICSPSRVAISTGQYPQKWGHYFLSRAQR